MHLDVPATPGFDVGLPPVTGGEPRPDQRLSGGCDQTRPKLQDSTPLTQASRRDLPTWLNRLIALAIVMLGTSNMANNQADADLWGHVQYGREVIADGRLPRQATWTYAAPQWPWVNHENIAELWVAAAYDGFGIWGLTISKWLMSLVIVGLMVWSSRRAGANWLITAFVVHVVSDLLYLHWHFRPQALTYTCFAILLALWGYAFGRWSDLLAGDSRAIAQLRRRIWILWSLPLLLVFWANSHGGFAAGAVILTVYHALRAVQLLRRGERLLALHLGIIAIVAVAATLINPYGLGLWRFMAMALTLRRTEIGDFQPLPLASFEAMMVAVLVLAIVLSELATPRRRDWVQLLLLGLLLWQGLAHARHIVIFALLCGFWLPVRMQDMAAWLRTQVKSPWEHLADSRRAQRRLAIVVSLFAVFGFVRTLPYLTEITVDRSFYPVAALEFMDRHELRGKTFASFNWGQYVLGYFATKGEGLIAVDGRYETCYPRSVIDGYFDFMFGPHDPRQRYRSPASPPFDPTWALRHGDPDLVLVERNSYGTRILESLPDEWVLLYRDDVAQLWGRREKYGDPASRHYIPAESRSLDSPADTLGHAPWPAFPTAS